MKAKELIKILKADPEAEIIVTTDNFEQGHNKVSLLSVAKWRMKKVQKEFVDAFDHERYHKEIYETDESGQEVFVL